MSEQKNTQNRSQDRQSQCPTNSQGQNGRNDQNNSQNKKRGQPQDKQEPGSRF